MKKINNIIFGFIICIISFMNSSTVFAASSSIAVKGTNKKVIVGETIKVTITVSSTKSLGSWEFDVKYDTDKLTLVSSTLEGKTRSVGFVSDSSTKSKTYTMTFKANQDEKIFGMGFPPSSGFQ